MRRKIQLLIIATLLLFVGEALAQQGFGTNQPDKSSAVDIVSSKRGLLIPRVALTQTTSSVPIIGTPAESLLVYNTATENDVSPGYYYWQDNRWVRFVASDTEKTVTVSEGENVKVEKDESGTTIDYTVSVKGGDTDGQVLVTKIDGTDVTTVWVDPSEFIEGVVTADSGLTMDSNHNITLGGALTKPTEIVTDDTNTLAISGLEDVSGTFDNASQKIVIMGSDGVLKVVSSDDIVKANETVTTLVANADGTYTYTSEDNTVTVIDIPNSVIENFETIVNGGPVEINGTTYTTIEEYIEQIASSSVTIEGSDFITVTGTGVATDPYVVTIEEGDDDSMLITNENGDLEWATIESIVKANETLTTLSYDSDTNKLSYEDEEGNTTNIDLNVGSVAYDAGANTITYTDETNVDTTLELNNTNLAYDEPNKSLTYTNSLNEDQTINLGALVTDNETVTLLVLNDGSNHLKPEGTYTYYNENEIDTDGTPLDDNVMGVTIDPKSANVTVADGVYTFKDSFNNIITEIDTNANAIAFDDSNSDLGVDNVQDAIDHLVSSIVTADNGLTKTDNNIQLGGLLIKPTEIKTGRNLEDSAEDATKTLAITGLQNSTAASTSIVLADEGTGVLRNVARSLEYTANANFNVATQGDYNKFVQEITIMATIGGTDLNITLPDATEANGQVINVKIANTTEPNHYVNIPNVDGVTIYGSMPYQGWIIKSNGTSWSVVGRM